MRDENRLAALELELLGYERKGDKKRADGVHAEIGETRAEIARARKPKAKRGEAIETADAAPEETTARGKATSR